MIAAADVKYPKPCSMASSTSQAWCVLATTERLKPQIREGSESGKQASLQLRQRRDFAVLRHEGKEVTDGNKFPILNDQGPHFCMRELEAFSH